MDEYGATMVRLTSYNYDIWKPKMEDILYCKDLYEPLLGDEGKPSTTSAKAWEVMHRKTVAHIRRYVDLSIFNHVSKETDAKVLWEKLQAMFEGKNAQNKASVIRKIVNLKYKDGRSMSEHMSDFQGLVNRLSTMKMVIDDELQALLLLGTLPDSWETLVVSMSNSAPDGKITYDMAKDRLMNEESRRRDTDKPSDSEALVSEYGRQGRGSYRNTQGRDRSRGRSQNRREVICHNCGKPGHIKRECRVVKREQRDQSRDRGDGENEENNTNVIVDEDDVVTIQEESHVDLSCEDWVVDSGAAFHVTARRDLFTSYTVDDFGSVRMGNESISKVVGIGEVCLETNIGCKLVLKNVRHVPNIRLNIISIGKLDGEGYNNNFSEGRWKLVKGSLVVARGVKESGLYTMKAKHWRNRLEQESGNGLGRLKKQRIYDHVEKNSPDTIPPHPLPMESTKSGGDGNDHDCSPMAKGKKLAHRDEHLPIPSVKSQVRRHVKLGKPSGVLLDCGGAWFNCLRARKVERSVYKVKTSAGVLRPSYQERQAEVIALWVRKFLSQEGNLMHDIAVNVCAPPPSRVGGDLLG